MGTGELERRRIRGVQLLLTGKNVREVANILKVSPSSVSDWKKRYRKKGWQGLCPSPRGRQAPIFTKRHRRSLRAIVANGPRKYGFDLDMWTVRLIQQALNRKMKTTFSQTTVLRYLHMEGFSFQRPKKVAYQRDPVEENRWLRRRLPKILASARKRKARVFFADESGFEMEMTRGGTWGRRGETPVVRRNGRRSKVTAVGAVSHKGDFLLRKYRKGGMTGARYAKFLEEVKKNTAGRLWLSMMGSRLTAASKSKRSSTGAKA